ncbi:glycosyltransferase [Bacillus thuringiensis]|uniref:Glycosyltransferase n=1 Tax=Bacillus cereus TaxID=1396 RepID=A0A9W7Q3A3_BACCE|nr:glycosyltransferase [Bacillus cereus]KAA6460478.1 glycosyltransferase [Bacillus cereus]KAB2500221.1 glycosyltransferase [Bacillus cereus]
MRTVLHLNLRVDPTQYVSQIREVPNYNYIHMVRQPQYMVDLSLLNDKVYYVDQIFSPKEYVKENNISLLHAHHGQLGMLLLPFKGETNLPLITSIRGRDATLANQPVGYLENMKMLFHEGDCFFPVCKYLADRLIAWGCPPEKIRVLYGGVDLNQYKYHAPNKGGSQNILSVGRLVEKKGHHILMQAFQKIRGKFPNATLTIIGRGELEEYIKSLAIKLNLGNSFRLLNHIPKDQVREQMNCADIFCAASLEALNGDIEGIPNTLKEAMAIGTPVISTYHAGIPELITNNKEGILVEENNINELADGLDFMLTHREMWETYTVAARKKVEQNFNLVQQLQQQAIFYDELLSLYKNEKKDLYAVQQLQQQIKEEKETVVSRKKEEKPKRVEKVKKALHYIQQYQQQIKEEKETVVSRKKEEKPKRVEKVKKALHYIQQYQQQAKEEKETVVSRKKEEKPKRVEKVKKALHYIQQYQQQVKEEKETVVSWKKEEKPKRMEKVKKALHYIQQYQQQVKKEKETVVFDKKDKNSQRAKKVEKALRYIQEQSKGEQLGG